MGPEVAPTEIMQLALPRIVLVVEGFSYSAMQLNGISRAWSRTQPGHSLVAMGYNYVDVFGGV